MTGKAVINGLLQNEPTDRLCWTTLIDTVTTSAMAERFQRMTPLEFYRHIGCDTLQFGNYGIDQMSMAVKYPYRAVTRNVETIQQILPRGVSVGRMISPWGVLESRYQSGHPVKYPVTNIDELRIYYKICLETEYVIDEAGCADSYRKMEEALGDSGVFIPITQESPVQMLLEFIMGVEAFYYFYADYPQEIEALLDIMLESRKQEYRLIAQLMPYSACIPVENTSTSYISPAFYRRFSVPQLRDYADILHSSEKKCILHMCGSIRDLLRDIADIGLDGVHALTPAPVGNTAFEQALDALGDRILIVGTLDSSVFQRADVSKQEIWHCLDNIYTPRMRQANFILHAVADGLPTDIDRFYYIQEWMDRYGRK